MRRALSPAPAAVAMRFTREDAVAIRRPFMRIVIVALVAVLLAAQTPFAASVKTILYATAATAGRVDGFCIHDDGSLAPTPKVHVDTGGAQPRRLLIGNNVLYVAEVDRLEAFKIGPAGNLTRLSSVKIPTDPRDIALHPDGKTLYVTHQGFIVAYALGADGSILDHGTCNGGGRPGLTCDRDADCPEGSCIAPPTCVQGGAGANYLDLQVTDRLLYVTADGIPGRVEVYCLCPNDSPDSPCGDPNRRPLFPNPVSCPIDASAGSLPQNGCGITKKKAVQEPLPDPPKWPDSLRTRILRPKALVVTGDMIYVEERARRRLIAFRLQPDGTFCDRKRNRDPKDKSDTFVEDCTGFVPLASVGCADREAKALQKNKLPQQCIASKTAHVLQYEGLALHTDAQNAQTLLGAQFFKGRVDSYRLQPDQRLPGPPRRLPKQPTAASDQDLAMTPVRLTVQGNRVYVAAGELDRVVAYRLKDNGDLAEKTPFSRTDEQKDSFPNDVAISMLSAPCE